MKNLYETLWNYGESSAYPFHMPGHKRQLEGENPFQIDITEIDGFDNLHHAEGILKEAQERAASVYGAEETFFLVNGSTSGILSAVSALVRPGGEILMARNCHKAAYHGCYLRDLKIHYLYPPKEEKLGINGGILPEDVDNFLKQYPNTEAVLITSPTYDGAVSDVERIAAAAHAHGVPLIVDEAHGAHFGFHPYFPKSALKSGADVVIQSLHKTLPSLTQTALLHVRGTRADRERLRRFLSIYQTSSPSYVFLASMDRCIGFLEKERQKFGVFAGRLEDFYRFSRGLSCIRTPEKELVGRAGIQDFDRSKILLFPGKAKSGEWIYQKLRTVYGLQLEMAAGAYALALTSVMDTVEGFERLKNAMAAIDRELEKLPEEEKTAGDLKGWPGENPIRKTLSEAMDGEKEEVLFTESEGRISGEFLYLYPPGIPLLAPGEEIRRELIREALEFQKQGLSLQGTADYAVKKIQVLKE